ncbi:Myb/SANT-like domain, harbinger transposase-derived nuclease domain protein [Tanacetum coccineum]
MIKVLPDKCIEEMKSMGSNDTSLHIQSWVRLGRVFIDKFNIDFNKKDVKNGFDNLKAKYVGWLYLKNKTGNLYNPDTKMFNLTQEEWDDFKQTNTEFEASESVSAASASGASAIRERVGELNIDDDPLVDVAVDDDDDGNSRAHKIHDEGAVGALDGTLIHARVPINKQHLYRGKGKGDCYQHVLAICDFNMMFTFLVAGWKGDFRRRRALNSIEKFNHSHAKLRNVIERAYGVMKAQGLDDELFSMYDKSNVQLDNENVLVEDDGGIEEDQIVQPQGNASDR